MGHNALILFFFFFFLFVPLCILHSLCLASRLQGSRDKLVVGNLLVSLS